MVTEKQREMYTALHDKLDAVYHQKEACRMDIHAFHVLLKKFYDTLGNTRQTFLQEPEYRNVPEHNVMDENPPVHMTLKQLKNLFCQLNKYLGEISLISREIESLMREMIQHHTILTTEEVTIEQSEEILTGLDMNIESVSVKLHEK